MIYTLIKEPFTRYLPENLDFCKKHDINMLHLQTCKDLGIEDIYKDLLWSFSDKLRNAFAEAYWLDGDDGREWRISYDTRHWVSMGAETRKNIIIHEVCHLAVEKLYGHGKKINGVKVTDHGMHWQDLMVACGQKPFTEVCKKYA